MFIRIFINLFFFLSQVWRTEVLEEFKKLLPTDTPKYLSSDFDDKINLLRRETNYLVGKAQRFIPKPKTTTTTPKVPVNNETKIEEPEEEGPSTTSATTPTPEQEQEEEETTVPPPTTPEEGIRLLFFFRFYLLF